MARPVEASGAPTDRRACRRWRRSELAWLASARLRTGLELDVLNLSAGGALVESGIRLLPGSRLSLLLAGPGACIGVTARVVRCELVSLHPAGARYRGAVAFESPLAIDDDLDGPGKRVPVAVGWSTSGDGNHIPAEPPGETGAHVGIR